MTKPAKVKYGLTTPNMNTATKLAKARTRKPKRLHKHPRTLCSKENRRTPSDQTVPCGKVQIRIILTWIKTQGNWSHSRRGTTALEKSYSTHMTASASWWLKRGLNHRILHDNRENNKPVRQGRRGGKPLRQDEKATFERLARRHSPD